jgi:hypothetical protein
MHIHTRTHTHVPTHCMHRCAEQSVTAVFALTRKKMGEVYGARKRVSAVALLELNGVDDLALQVRGTCALILLSPARAAYICLYIYLLIHLFICLYMPLYLFTHLSIFIITCTCRCAGFSLRCWIILPMKTAHALEDAEQNTHTHIHKHAHTYSYTHTHAHTHKHTHIYIYIYNTYSYTRILMQTHKHTHTQYTNSHTQTHTYSIHKLTHTNTHKHTHTNTHRDNTGQTP